MNVASPLKEDDERDSIRALKSSAFENTVTNYLLTWKDLQHRLGNGTCLQFLVLWQIFPLNDYNYFIGILRMVFDDSCILDTITKRSIYGNISNAL